MKLTTSHSEVFGSLADDIDKNGAKWKEVTIILCYSFNSPLLNLFSPFLSSGSIWMHPRVPLIQADIAMASATCRA